MTRDRTRDLQIFSLTLSQLSYPGEINNKLNVNSKRISQGFFRYYSKMIEHCSMIRFNRNPDYLIHFIDEVSSSKKLNKWSRDRFNILRKQVTFYFEILFKNFLSFVLCEYMISFPHSHHLWDYVFISFVVLVMSRIMVRI